MDYLSKNVFEELTRFFETIPYRTKPLFVLVCLKATTFTRPFGMLAFNTKFRDVPS